MTRPLHFALPLACAAIAPAHAEPMQQCYDATLAPEARIAACTIVIGRAKENGALINAYISRGKSYFLRLRYDEAIADLQAALALDPKAADAAETLKKVKAARGAARGPK